MTNKEKVFAINRAAQSLDIEKAAALISENEILQTPLITNRINDYISYLGQIKSNDVPVPKLNTIRVLEDGEYVALHHEAYWPDRKAMFEIFRFHDGLVTEHLSAFMDHPDFTLNQNSMFDGETEMKNFEETIANKERVKILMEEVFFEEEFK